MIHQPHTFRASAGFTLIELIIAIAVVSILTAIAYPNYVGFIQKARRVDAQAEMVRLMNQQEVYYNANQTYTTTPDDIKLTDIKHYRLSFAECIESTVQNCVAITAEPLPESTQRKDTDCKHMTLASNGRRSATNTSDVDSTDKCWKN
ncbi:MAG: type IV pilin protein [Arenicellales bacterium WSBS_2016_MAG_OTU3]